MMSRNPRNKIPSGQPNRSERTRTQLFNRGQRGSMFGKTKFLLDFSDGTFTRSSEAAFQDPRDNWRFQGSSEAENWKGPNIPRIFNDGAILIEGSRTNLMFRSEELDVSPWGNGATNASSSAESLQAPDLGTDADLLYFQDATVNPQWRQTIAAAGFSNNLSGSFTVWIQTTGSEVTEEVRLFSRAKDGSTLDNTPVTASNTWTVYTHTFGQHSGTIDPLAGIRNGESGGIKTFRAWGAQVEANSTFPSSYIRTTTAAATRAKDVLTFPAGTYNAAVMASSGFEFDLYPSHASTDAITAGYIILRGTQTAVRWAQPSVIRINISGGTPTELTFGSLVYSKHQKLTIRVDMLNRTATLSGFTSGNATKAFPDTFDDGSSGTLYIGGDSFGNVAMQGVISRLRRIR